MSNWKDAEITRLRAELAEAYARIDNIVFDASDELRTVYAELAEARKDAERYRWLRQPPQYMGWVLGDFQAEFIDTEIDAAMAEKHKA